MPDEMVVAAQMPEGKGADGRVGGHYSSPRVRQWIRRPTHLLPTIMATMICRYDVSCSLISKHARSPSAYLTVRLPSRRRSTSLLHVRKCFVITRASGFLDDHRKPLSAAPRTYGHNVFRLSAGSRFGFLRQDGFQRQW